MKLASAVVLYNPEKSVIDNIRTYLFTIALLLHVSKLYLFEKNLHKKCYRKEFTFIAALKLILLQKKHLQVYKMIRRGISDGKKGILGTYKEKNK